MSESAAPEVRPISTLRVFGLHLLYDAGYILFVILLSPVFLYKFLTSRRARAGVGQRLGFIPRREGDAPCIWIHGVSVGEIKAAKGLLRGLDERLPGWEIVLSTTTLQGYRVAKKDYPERHTVYYPLDFSWVTRQSLRRIRPAAVVLMELELWPNFLLACYHRRLPVCVVNGRISERSYRGYRTVRRFLPEPHQRIRFYAVQNEEYEGRLLDLGVRSEAVRVTGQMKYDNIDLKPEDLERRRAERRRMLGVAADEWVLMGGSTHPSEEATLVEILAAMHRAGQRARLILAPRHLERLSDVVDCVVKGGYRVVKRTSIDGEARPLEDDEVVVLDTIGELAQFYPVSDLVFVGGSLIPHGGQSMIEPAALGLAVIFGPNVWNFADSADALLRADAAVQVEDRAGLRDAIERLYRDPDGARTLGERALHVVTGLKGATDRNVDLIARMVSPTDDERAQA